jgi:hypothetical protein
VVGFSSFAAAFLAQLKANFRTDWPSLFFDNRDINAEPCHTAGDGAADVVQDPLRHRRRKLIDPALYQMSAADRIAAAYREHKLRAVDARESGQ